MEYKKGKDFDFNKVYISASKDLGLFVVDMGWIQLYDFKKQKSQKSFMPETRNHGYNTVQFSYDDRYAFVTRVVKYTR